MFRKRKTDLPLSYSRSTGRPAFRRPLPGNLGRENTEIDDFERSLGSTGPRWLTGSDEPTDLDEGSADLDDAGNDVLDDEGEVFELSNPLDDVDAERNDDDEAPSPAPSEEPASPLENQVPTANEEPAVETRPPSPSPDVGLMPSLEFDDDDDLYDFDEIPLAHLVEKAAPPRFDHAASVVSEPEPTRPVAPQDEQKNVPLTVVSDAPTDTATSEGPVCETIEPEQDVEPDVIPTEAILETEAPQDEAGDGPTTRRLEEAQATSVETGLALRPIPELQTEPRKTVKPSTAPTTDPDDDLIDPVESSPQPEEPWDFVDEPAPAQASDDDLDPVQPDHDSSETTELDIEALEFDSFDMDSTDESDDPIADDWHAHLADALGHEREPGTASPPRPMEEPSEPLSNLPSDLEDEMPPILPLPVTSGNPNAVDSSATDQEDVSVPDISLLTKKTRPLPRMNQPPPAIAPEAGELSHVQLSLGIVANLPRLRRFAAAQIGDELLADRLVTATTEAALADVTLLQPASDLGLGLIRLLYQNRRHMLEDPSAIDRSPNGLQAFETTLCDGLSGADQFEIRQFAGAINRLDERDRELLLLANLENLTYDQIADIVRAPRKRVMAMVCNARMRLRQALSADETDANDESAAAIYTPHAREIDIHGYLDGELDSDHMADIDTLIELDEDAADRLVHYGIQGDLIRRLYAPLLNRSIPGAMLESLAAMAKPTRRGGFRLGARRALIACAIVIVLGFGAIGSDIAVAALGGLFSKSPTITSMMSE